MGKMFRLTNRCFRYTFQELIPVWFIATFPILLIFAILVSLLTLGKYQLIKLNRVIR